TEELVALDLVFYYDQIIFEHHTIQHFRLFLFNGGDFGRVCNGGGLCFSYWSIIIFFNKKDSACNGEESEKAKNSFCHGHDRLKNCESFKYKHFQKKSFPHKCGNASFSKIYLDLIKRKSQAPKLENAQFGPDLIDLNLSL